MPDRDQFALATRRARNAFIVPDDLKHTHGAPVVQIDQTSFAAWLGRLFSVCKGLPSLAPVLDAVRELAEAPLLARDPARCDQVLDKIDAAVNMHGQTDLDLVLRRAAAREVLAGRYEPHDIVGRFFRDAVVRYAIEAKNGLADRVPEHVLSREREHLESAMKPVLRDATRILTKKPDLQQLKITSRHRRNNDVYTENFSTGACFHASSA